MHYEIDITMSVNCLDNVSRLFISTLRVGNHGKSKRMFPGQRILYNGYILIGKVLVPSYIHIIRMAFKHITSLTHHTNK